MTTAPATPTIETLQPSYPHEPLFPAYMDSTMLTTAKSCKRKFYEEYICRRSPVERSPDLHGGGAVATFFEHFRRAFYEEGLPERDAIMVAAREFFLAWGDYEPPFGHVKTMPNMFGACLDYLREYPPADDQVKPMRTHGNKVGVEFTFAVPIPVRNPHTGELMIYCGRFDMLGEMGISAWCVDEKTTKGFFKNWSDQWHLRSQFIGYTWGARETGIKVEGAIVRGIAIQKSQYQHRQAIIPYTDHKIELWYNQMVRDVEALVKCWTDGYFDYDFGEACNAYGGCQFRPMCNSDEPENWHGDYKERMWNPLLKDPSKRRAPCTPVSTAP